MIVADTNLVAYLIIEGAHTQAARAVHRRDSIWVLPPLWRSEFLSVLAVSVRGGVLTKREARSAWRSAVVLVRQAELEPDPMAVLHLALSRNISAYDSQFVVLAQMLDTVLVTGDRKLARRCPDEAVLMQQFSVKD